MTQVIDYHEDRPLVIGLTGGIGSGKSAAAKAFERLGVPRIDADRVARELVQPQQPALAQIIEEFGEKAGTLETGLDRQYMRQYVFSDDGARKRLEQILHPAIRAKMFQQALAQESHYVILEIPLLVENGLQDRVDRVLLVDCTVATQIQRVSRRDNENPNTIRALIAAQASREQRLAVAHDVILNEHSLDVLEECVTVLHDAYQKLDQSTVSQYPPIRLP